jgi:predicted transport protein
VVPCLYVSVVSDIKLFQLATGAPVELMAHSVTVEKSLQDLLEGNLDAFLGVRLLASEYVTGKVHGGRIDTLGIDENNSPVIIEYKRSLNENVINQGLFYLDWLLDHRAEFTLLAMNVLGLDVQEKVDWSAPRLVCIAGDFTKYDEHAVQQIDRNIELIRYRRYNEGFLVLELVNATTGSSQVNGNGASPKAGGPKAAAPAKSVAEYYADAPPHLRDLHDNLEAFLLALGDDVTKKTLKFYFAFRRLKNFACVEVHPQSATLLVYAKVDPDNVPLEDGFTRDVRGIGHYGTGDLEIRIKTQHDLERAKALLVTSYEGS